MPVQHVEISDIEFIERTYVNFRWDPNTTSGGSSVEMASQEGMERYLGELITKGAWDITVQRYGYDDVLVGPNHWSEYA